MEAEAPRPITVSPDFGRMPRPAPRRMFAVGLMKRKIATVRATSSAEICGISCSGVPLIGISAFSGID